MVKILTDFVLIRTNFVLTQIIYLNITLFSSAPFLIMNKIVFYYRAVKRLLQRPAYASDNAVINAQFQFYGWQALP
jgi:hypothetical protein